MTLRYFTCKIHRIDIQDVRRILTLQVTLSLSFYTNENVALPGHRLPLAGRQLSVRVSTLAVEKSAKRHAPFVYVNFNAILRVVFLIYKTYVPLAVHGAMNFNIICDYIFTLFISLAVNGDKFHLFLNTRL